MADQPTPAPRPNPAPHPRPHADCTKVQHTVEVLEAHGIPPEVAQLIYRISGCSPQVPPTPK